MEGGMEEGDKDKVMDGMESSSVEEERHEER